MFQRYLLDMIQCLLQDVFKNLLKDSSKTTSRNASNMLQVWSKVYTKSFKYLMQSLLKECFQLYYIKFFKSASRSVFKST